MKTGRILFASLAAFVALSLWAGPAMADTTATTGITVTTQDVGALEVGFEQLDEGYTFRNAAGDANLAVNALSGDVATTIVRITWSDTRNDETRTAFRILLGIGDLISTVNAPGRDQPAVIAAGQVSVIQIGDAVLADPLALDVAKAIFISADEPAAGEQTLEIVLQLVVPPSSFALTYQTAFEIQVIPGPGEP